uniref:Potassium channel domain-containing protein n=2 Tax=Acrobeloides nanus TaxID=290746 RepID=A0A914EB84_9BILA
MESKQSESKFPRVSSFINWFIKIALPHVGLYSFIFWYLMAGSWSFARLEGDAERAQQEKKLNRIRIAYQQIADEMSDHCGVKDFGQEVFEKELYHSLSRLSTFMENHDFHLSPDIEPNLDELLPPRWDFMSSILYALSILTTTGYAYANPSTGLGQCFAIGYGLIGIPLMVLAAVDIGRFLSDVVLFVYSKIESIGIWKRIASLCGFPKNANIVTQVEIKAIKVLQHTKRRMKRHKSSHEKPEAIEENPKKRLPLSVNAAILLMFCMLGGLVYIVAGGNQKTFIEAFFVTFNLVANLTMSEMPFEEFQHVLTLFYISFFVTFGLAVLSMCADLAASELKWVFLKIHYFGRKINWKRKVAKKEQMEVEVKELLKIINQIRAKYPDKEQITSMDILQYMSDLNGWDPMMHFKNRRDTIAFMPQSIEALKFADDIDFEEASHRSVIRNEDDSLLLIDNL